MTTARSAISGDRARQESLATYPEIADRAVVISSFAKTYHTTGWKVGYCAAPPALTSEIQSIHQWVTFAVNHPAQMAYADIVRANPECRDVTTFYQGCLLYTSDAADERSSVD